MKKAKIPTSSKKLKLLLRAMIKLPKLSLSYGNAFPTCVLQASASTEIKETRRAKHLPEELQEITSMIMHHDALRRAEQ